MPTQTKSPQAATAPAPRSTHRAIRRYGAVYEAAAIGVAVAVVALLFNRPLAFALGSSGFFFAYLVAIVARLPRLTAEHLRAHADQSDVPGYVIVIISLVTVIAASVSLFTLLNGGGHLDSVRMWLGVLALVLGWLTIHTMLAFHYAYEYYQTDAASPAAEGGRRRHVGGLLFPGSERPDGLSFLYFSFVVAMTAQVSDVQVTSNPMRRLVLLHGILSYVFTTVILATSVNIIVSVGH